MKNLNPQKLKRTLESTGFRRASKTARSAIPRVRCVTSWCFMSDPASKDICILKNNHIRKSHQSDDRNKNLNHKLKLRLKPYNFYYLLGFICTSKLIVLSETNLYIRDAIKIICISYLALVILVPIWVLIIAHIVVMLVDQRYPRCSFAWGLQFQIKFPPLHPNNIIIIYQLSGSYTYSCILD